MKLEDLTQEQFDELWGDGGPYSEAYLTVEARILDNAVSRHKLIVSAKVNPFTFELCKENRKKFIKDKLIIDILKSSYWIDGENGYEYVYFSEDYMDDGTFDHADKHFKELKEAVREMHAFVMDELGIEKLKLKGRKNEK